MYQNIIFLNQKLIFKYSKLTFWYEKWIYNLKKNADFCPIMIIFYESIMQLCFEMVKVIQMYAKKVTVRYYPHSNPDWRLSTGRVSHPPTLKSCRVMF